MNWISMHMLRPVLGLLLLLCGTASFAQQGATVTGKVSAAADKTQGLPGVTVTIAGTTSGTTTDAKGAFKIKAAPNATLIFSFLGYKKETVPVNGRREITVLLKEDVAALEQVVVIGYGTAKKRDLTGAVSSINAAKLENENPTSVQDVLRSNLPGLNVGYSTSAKGGGSLEIRGKNTLNAGSSPLLVLDGAIYYGGLEDINPTDIETVDVLKDASSAAVYGAKAASGVILITTKKGKSSKPTINVSSNIGVATMSVNQKVYDPEGFVNWREDVERSTHVNAKPYQYSDPRELPSDISVEDWLAYDNANPNADPVDIWLQRLNMQPVEIANYKAGKTLDWYNKVFQNGLRQDHTISVSGRKDELSYYWSVGYMNNEGIVVGDKYNTLRSRLNLEAKVTKFLSAGINAQFAARDEGAVPVDWKYITRNSPWGSFYEDDSSGYRYSPNDDPGGGSRNPFAIQQYTRQMKKIWTLNATMFAKATLPFGITYQLNFTPRFEWYNFFQSQSSQYKDWAPQGGLASREEHQMYQWQVDNLIKWSKTFADHHLDVTLLANSEKYQIWDNKMSNSGFQPSDVLGYDNLGAGIKPVIANNGDFADEYSTGDALMARLFYSFKDRYMLTLSVRRDGYSAFGANNKRATFPSAALGWVFTDEPFLKSDWFNYGKLRFSYGINGNRDIGRYVALSDLTTGKYLHVNSGGTVIPVSQLYVNNMANPNLRWEKTAAYNVGLDFSLFHDIISGSIEAYQSQTTDLLVKRSLPNIIGFDLIWTNLGEVDNKGIELNLSSKNIDQQNFKWNTSFNFSLNRNSIVHLYGDKVPVKDANGNIIGSEEPDDITNKWFIGHPLDAIWDIRTLGVYQSKDAETAKKYGQSPGDFRLEDVNNDGKYTNADRQFLGYKEPRYRFTLRNEFKLFHNFDVSFMAYALWGHMTDFNQAKNRGDAFLDRVSSYVFPYWTPENPNNEWARLYSSDGSASYSVYKKRSFIRLDNVSLAYTFPQRLIERASIQNLRVYFTVKNAAVYAPDWNYWDPEWDPNVGPGPTPRFYTFGLNVTL